MENWFRSDKGLLRTTYGFDDVSLVPGEITIDPQEVDITTTIGGEKLDIPILGAAMDGVIDPRMAVEMGRLGGWGVLNLEGLFTRYDDPYSIIEEMVNQPREKITDFIQEVYRVPIKEHLVGERIQEIKREGVKAVASLTPSKAETLSKVAQEAGLDILVIQSTVTTLRYHSSTSRVLDLEKFCRETPIPVILGNCATYKVALDLMKAGAAGILVGIGPGAACTTRAVLGIGVPQVTATWDAARARDTYLKATGKYVAVITDGGMRVGGDIAKAIASGADAVMLGSPLASAQEAPGKGHHWGMATPDPNLPRGTLVKVGIRGTLKEILLGPSHLTDGTMNLVGALRSSMGSLGAKTIREMQEVEIVVAPSIWTEGKFLQRTQGVGMGK
ncbi:MAG TPA: GuaB3 family IMP dehydrogenase-related protein [Candidatus Atribacteria bacterium]|jgi:IMP dehydrogenase|nr:GuaB3 family IMP dehydrogenase-related protein [Candidatus Atribacteria bacterium]HPT63780.1 GuaB3 family IMP dehydrogenase-related protein [Candidatus Atribacteria bacterium]HQD33101.1 GuaB3 family IMP dehydrogenase-related protein [Candidatus Atribacteria bacterium]